MTNESNERLVELLEKLLYEIQSINDEIETLRRHFGAKPPQPRGAERPPPPLSMDTLTVKDFERRFRVRS